MTGIATKLAAAGYRTHSFGKWDAGMATPDHTPHGRGYQSAMNYCESGDSQLHRALYLMHVCLAVHHDNDYWSMVVGSCPTGPRPPPTHQPAGCDVESYRSVCFGSSPASRSTMTRSATDCCAECHADPLCKGFAWGLTCPPHALGNCSCNMKSAVHKPNPGNCTSGCKDEGCLNFGERVPPPPPHQGTPPPPNVFCPAAQRTLTVEVIGAPSQARARRWWTSG